MDPPQDIQEPEPSQAERYSCRADPRDQSAGVAHDGYRLRPDARPTTWPETARAASDLSGCDPQSNWLQDVEAATFAILKGRFHAHAPSIDLHLSASGSLIADEQPWFLTVWVPDKTDVCVQRFLLPDPGFAIPAIATRLPHDVVKAFPRLFQFPVEEARARVCSAQMRNR